MHVATCVQYMYTLKMSILDFNLWFDFVYYVEKKLVVNDLPDYVLLLINQSLLTLL